MTARRSVPLPLPLFRPNPAGLSDDEILAAAATVAARRAATTRAHLDRLFRTYARGRAQAPHALGRPALLPDEALLLTALERNRYDVEAEPAGGRWNGEASCRHHVRDTVMLLRADTRLDLLWGLWAAVSDPARHEDNGEASGDAPSTHVPTLTEEHFAGSVVQADIRVLNRAVRTQAIAGT